MGFALAHDENGVPLDVPASASGWLVRKHSGGRGRPAAVYDQEGRPLVVPLDATVVDLRGCGCKPGMYRLDAVDGGRKPLGITAYTEVMAGADDPVDAVPGSAGDAAVAALARAVEAMQRVQAERERVQAQMFMRLIERLAPTPAQPANDLAAMVRQIAETQDALNEVAESRAPRNAALDEDEEPVSVWEQPAMVQAAEVVVNAGLPMLSKWLWQKLGLSDKQVADLAAATGQKTPGSASSGSQGHTDSAPAAAAEPAESAGGTEEVKKLELVFKQLAPDEQQRAQLAIQLLPEATVNAVQDKLLAMDPKEAAEYLRSLDRKFGGATTAGNEAA